MTIIFVGEYHGYSLKSLGAVPRDRCEAWSDAQRRSEATLETAAVPGHH